MKVRRCKYCDEILLKDDDESLFDVTNSQGVNLGDMHYECAVENLPPGEYEARKFWGMRFYFTVRGCD